MILSTSAVRRELPPRTERIAIRTLQVVLKVVERCNINCSYCYYFNMGSDAPMQRPSLITPERIATVGRFLREGCAALGVEDVHVAFHGGEPMLMKPRLFDAACSTLREALDGVVPIAFGVQTNGTILSDAWLDVLGRHQVQIGVSIDGNRAAHDRFRLSHRNTSTFDITVETLQTLVRWSSGNRRLGPFTISVLHPDNDYRAQYAFLRSFGVKDMSFLLPDRSHDPAPGTRMGEPAQYGKVLTDLFDAWFDEDNCEVGIRQFDALLDQLRPPRGNASARPGGLPKYHQVIVIGSDGSLGPSDSYVPAARWYNSLRPARVEDTTLREFLDSGLFDEIERAESTLPEACHGCRWRGPCGGGDLENRHSARNGFDNASVYCGALTGMYEHVSARLVQAGYPEPTLHERLRALAEARTRLLA